MVPLVHEKERGIDRQRNIGKTLGKIAAFFSYRNETDLFPLSPGNEKLFFFLQCMEDLFSIAVFEAYPVLTVKDMFAKLFCQCGQRIIDLGVFKKRRPLLIVRRKQNDLSEKGSIFFDDVILIQRDDLTERCGIIRRSGETKRVEGIGFDDLCP